MQFTGLFSAIAAADPTTTALLLAAFGLMVAFAVLGSGAANRLGVPVVLLFLALGMLGGSEGLGGIEFSDYGFAMQMGTAALVLILFDGGLNTSAAAVRQVLWPAATLATVGVGLTAALVAGTAKLLGLGWTEALLLGAVVSSTDAAAVFALLRGGGLHLTPRVGRTIEVESCINDPMAVILTTSTIAAMTELGSADGGGAGVWLRMLWTVPLQLAVGALVGYGIGRAGRALLMRVRLTTAGLYPALTLALALVSFGVATVLWGSGFLAVFVTALVLGNGPLPYRSGLTRIHDALAWLSQIGMFLMLGLLVFPSRLVDVALAGAGVGLALALIARPLATLLCLAPFRYPAAHVACVGWTGLRGAVPIILATFPVLAGVAEAERMFDLVFFIVVVSSFVPGALIRPVVRGLRLNVAQPPAPPAVLEINASHALDGELVSYHIVPELAVTGATLAQLVLPPDSAVVLIVRDKSLMPARGATVLIPGDHAYIFCRNADRPYFDLLFGRPER